MVHGTIQPARLETLEYIEQSNCVYLIKILSYCTFNFSVLKHDQNDFTNVFILLYANRGLSKLTSKL